MLPGTLGSALFLFNISNKFPRMWEYGVPVRYKAQGIVVVPVPRVPAAFCVPHSQNTTTAKAKH